MEPVLVLLILAVGWVVVMPVVALALAARARETTRRLEARLAELSGRIAELDRELRPRESATVPEEEASPEQVAPPVLPATPAPLASIPPVMEAPEPMPVAPPLIEPESPPSPPAPAARPAWAGLNWEQFVGVKLFAWAAGLALFLGVGFFLKWSFEHGYITPPIRVAMGFVTGIGLLVGGLRLPRPRYAVLAQALTGAGVVILYADIFASCSFYHFIPPGAAFLLMALVTAVAFLLAVRLDAPAVAILGLLGGFLTPPLLSTGEDRPFALFGYIGLLDAGLLAVALRQRWNYLALLAALATITTQFAWAGQFFAVEKMPVATGIFLCFAALFTGAHAVAQRQGRVDGALTAAAALVGIAALAFAFYLQAEPYLAIVSRPALLFVLVFGADAALLTMAAVRPELRRLHLLAGGLVFFQLMFWTGKFLTAELLTGALGVYLLFGVAHAVFPVALERWRPSGQPEGWAHLFAPLALILMMLPLVKLVELSLLLWPAILLVDLLAILLAFLTASIMAIVAVLLLTAVATGFWILKMPPLAGALPEALLIVGAFAALFFGAGVWLARRWPSAPADAAATPRRSWLDATAPWELPPEIRRALIPALSAGLPFLLLSLMVTRVPLPNPSPVFGLAALMVVLLLGVVRLYQADWAALAGLAGVVLLEGVWQSHHLDPDAAFLPLVWYVGFYLVFGLFPFVMVKPAEDRLAPWLVSALAGPAQFYLTYRLIACAYPNEFMGLVPAAFAVPSLLALVRLSRALPKASPRRTTQLALFGGVALLFITLIFPIQFEKQWITIAWALEGTALLWLLHRVPHPGLKYVGVALLATAFVRLALNPAVFEYHPRTPTPILNWYLYAYGIVTACLFLGARLLAPPRNLIGKVNAPPVLAGLGTVLAFLLVNIQIADYFSTGTTITFKFSGNFARDMTYSLAWGLFGFGLLLAGILRTVRWARYAGLGLLVVTLLKLFLHDLWSLGGLYRIGSLIGLALVLIPVSFLYQRFLATNAGKPDAGEKES